MQIDITKVQQLGELLAARESQNIVIVAHTNPDGDALGSTLAWARVLTQKGHNVSCIAPNKYPYFMEWMEGIKDYIIHRLDEQQAKEAIDKADIIFCMDFNTTGRLEALGELIDDNNTAKRVLIDHHLAPSPNFDIIFSYPEESSTCLITYSLIVAYVSAEAIDNTTANLLYTGIMTDTGNFSYANLSPDLFRAVATLVERGADIPRINQLVNNSYSLDRAKLFGYVVNRKMEVVEEGRVAYISLTEAEMRRFKFQPGDSEGFVNFPLSVASMQVSVLFTAHRGFVRVSLRSRKHIDINYFAKKYFNGGGHKNAAGGKSFFPMEQTIEHFKKSIAEFISQGGFCE
ncbi:MAG: bifunctional oligoribonuclease/PAP phosphatase NrnA [Rikenellaceae bacterium]